MTPKDTCQERMVQSMNSRQTRQGELTTERTNQLTKGRRLEQKGGFLIAGLIRGWKVTH